MKFYRVLIILIVGSLIFNICDKFRVLLMFFVRNFLLIDKEEYFI